MMTTRELLLSHLSLRSVYYRYAWRLTLACFFTISLYTFLDIHNGYWAVFSVIACVWPTQGVSLQRIRQRLVGTFLGIGLGIVIAHSFLGSSRFIDTLLPVFIFLMFYLKAYNYSLFVLFTTVVTMLLVCLLDPGNWQIAAVRLEMTLFGVIIAFFSTLWLFPVHESKRMPQHLQLAQRSLQHYFSALCALYQTPENCQLTTIQVQTYKYLQVALVAAQESTLELGRSKRYPQHLMRVVQVQRIYEKLLRLDIHLPKPLVDNGLHHIMPPLAQSMTLMLTLFETNNAVQGFKINTQLAELKSNVTAQRILLARDVHLKAAIFHDHIRLTLFIETLQALLVDLQKLH